MIGGDCNCRLAVTEALVLRPY